MILRVALRSLGSRPVRSAVLAGGFGLGVAVMSVLLGVSAVILDQARAPALIGGGDVIIGSVSGRLPNAQFLLSSVLNNGSLGDRVRAAAPSDRAALYLVDGGSATPVRARGGVPSLDRAMNDPETSGVAAWVDTDADRAWAAPNPETVLHDMDRFHAMPDVPARASSWAEWLYFNGRAGDDGFYVSFLAGPPEASGRRRFGVRLQLDRGGRMTTYSQSEEVSDADLVSDAPNVTIGANRVRLVGREYRVSLDLPSESGHGRARGDLVITATPGRSLPPFTIRGAGGWISGYVVPVMSGPLNGSIGVDDREVNFDGGTGYHDHNWGFWEGVSWQWGQVQGSGLSFVYGRVHPPADAADPSRLPAFLIALGPDAPIGYASDVTIDESNRPGTDLPEHIVIRGRSASMNITLDLGVTQTTLNRGAPTGRSSSGSAAPSAGALGAAAPEARGRLDFLQLRAEYHVKGQVGSQAVDFTAPGSAETFRGR